MNALVAILAYAFMVADASAGAVEERMARERHARQILTDYARASQIRPEYARFYDDALVRTHALDPGIARVRRLANGLAGALLLAWLWPAFQRKRDRA